MMSPRYITLIMSTVISTTTMAVAAPICAQVLRASPTQEQITVMFDDLARMTLEADTEKISGIKKSQLQTELVRKTTEIVGILGLKKSDLEQALKPRLKDLQKTRELKEEETTRVRAEQSEALIKYPRFKLTETIPTPAEMSQFLGVSERINGRHQILYFNTPTQSGEKNILAKDPVTGVTTIVAENILGASIDSHGRQIITYSADSDFAKAQLQAYSLNDLKPQGSPVELNWPAHNLRGLKDKTQISVAADGDTFVISSSSVSAASYLSNTEIHLINSGNFLNTLILDHTEYVASSPIHVSLSRMGAKQYPTLAIPTRGFMKNLFRLDENHIIAVSSDLFSIVDVKNWKVKDTLPHNMTELVHFKEQEHTYIVGLERGELALHNLDEYSGKSLYNFDSVPRDFKIEKLYLSADENTLIVKGVDHAETPQLLILDKLGAKQ